MGKKCLYFYITELTDGNLIIDTYDMHYAFLEELYFEDIKPSALYLVMKCIKQYCDNENIKPIFKMR